jgi:hypothetical protein
MELAEYIVVVNTQNPPTQPPHISVAPCVIGLSLIAAVRLAVNLDNNAALNTGEIRNEWADRMLPPETGARDA